MKSIYRKNVHFVYSYVKTNKINFPLLRVYYSIPRTLRITYGISVLLEVNDILLGFKDIEDTIDKL